jgi:hypothetical protein
MVLEVEHLMHVEEIVEIVDRAEVVTGGKRRIGTRRPPQKKVGGDVWSDGANL